jgi:hypothetical protein
LTASKVAATNTLTQSLLNVTPSPSVEGGTSGRRGWTKLGQLRFIRTGYSKPVTSIHWFPT